MGDILVIVAMGLSTVFLVLALLYFMMLGLKIMFDSTHPANNTAPVIQAAVETVQPVDSDEEIAAVTLVIAAATENNPSNISVRRA